MFTKLDQFIIEKNITTISNKVAVHHWYTNEPCYVSIKESKHGKVLVTHDIEEDKLFGCPDWWVNTYEIIGKVDESILSKIDESFNESVYNVITNTVKKKQGIYTVKNNDFHLIFDIVDDILELTWITINTNKFTGKEVLLGLIEYCKQFNITKIKATGVRDKHHGKDSYGYYVMLKWGFIPIQGITFINDVLNTNYKSFEDAFIDSNFLPKWKINGIEFDGIFDLNPNSLSIKQFNK